MKNPICYGKNLLRKGWIKLRFGQRVTMGNIQSFERLRIELKHNGRLKMGSCNQNRERLFLGIDGGILSIGSHCFFNINSSITCMNSVSIGNNCKFGNNLVIVDHDHNFKKTEPEFLTGSVTIGDNVWVGAGVIILKDSVIGSNCVIAAGSVVKGVIPPNTIFVQKRVDSLSEITNIT